MPRGRNEPPPLTGDLHLDFKNRLTNLSTFSRASEFSRNPFKLRHFVRELQEICDLLEFPLTEKSYRKGYGYKMLHAFLGMVPDSIGTEMLSYTGQLPLTGFLTFTILITLVETQWVFIYNSLTHKICNCTTLFPGVQRCLAPAMGELSSATESGLAASLAASHAANLAGVATGATSLTDRIDHLQQHERHFDTKLLELSSMVKKRIGKFCAQIPTFLSDLTCLPTSGPEKHQKWGALYSAFTSEVSALDLYYMHFEQMYLALVNKMIGTALEPVRGMSGPSSSLVNAMGDPFRPVQTAVLCQRLGLLKQQVSFGGPHNLIYFDSLLLVKAQRVLQMNTFEEVQRMAVAMLTSFDSLCDVLVNLHDDHVHPELCENIELRQTVINLEAIWAECQFVLQQGALDFLQQLLEYLPEVGATERWQLHLAMQDDSQAEVGAEPESHERQSTKVTNEKRHSFTTSQRLQRDPIGNRHSAEGSESEADKPDWKKERESARKMFFETLPILVYIDEMRRDIKLSEEGKETGASAHFRDLFCPKNDRHHMLRRDFAKFDDKRFQSFRNFLLGVQEEGETEGAGLHATYFQNVYKQLREVAAFSIDKSPMEALQVATCLDAAEMLETHDTEDMLRHKAAVKMAAEARARWVCVQRVAQTVQPELFPHSKPEIIKVRKPTELDLLLEPEAYYDFSPQVTPHVSAQSQSLRPPQSSQSQVSRTPSKKRAPASASARTPIRKNSRSSRKLGSDAESRRLSQSKQVCQTVSDDDPSRRISKVTIAVPGEGGKKGDPG